MRREKTVKLECLDQEIVVKSPTVGVMRRALNSSKDQLTQTIQIISSCTNMSEEELDNLEFADFAILQQTVEDFTKSGQNQEGK